SQQPDPRNGNDQEPAAANPDRPGNRLPSAGLSDGGVEQVVHHGHLDKLWGGPGPGRLSPTERAKFVPMMPLCPNFSGQVGTIPSRQNKAAGPANFRGVWPAA